MPAVVAAKAADDADGSTKMGTSRRKRSPLIVIGMAIGVAMLIKDCADAMGTIPGPPSRRVVVLLHSPVALVVVAAIVVLAGALAREIYASIRDL